MRVKACSRDEAGRESRRIFVGRIRFSVIGRVGRIRVASRGGETEAKSES